MDVFNEYEIIDKHINFSSELHLLNITGKHLIREVEKKKHIRQKKSGNYVFAQDVQSIMNVIIDITNTKRFNKLRLYFCIQYYLDELMFKFIKNLDNFYIEDECYKLTDLYFNQTTWNTITIDDIPQIKLSDDKFINADEALIFQSYFNQYTYFLDIIIKYIERLQEVDYIRRKFKNICNRIKNKITNINQIIQKAIDDDIH
jgi:hypothetical protein